MKILLVVKVGSQENRSNQLKYIQSKIKTKKKRSPKTIAKLITTCTIPAFFRFTESNGLVRNS